MLLLLDSIVSRTIALSELLLDKAGLLPVHILLGQHECNRLRQIRNECAHEHERRVDILYTEEVCNACMHYFWLNHELLSWSCHV